jgi:hypothetical protein
MQYPIVRFAIGAILACTALSSLAAATPARAQDGTWSALESGPAPFARREFGAVYDVKNHRYISFSGFTNIHGTYELLNEVWTLSLDGPPVWSPVALSGAVPGPRHSPQWGYDPARNRVLVFGGYGQHYPGWGYEYLNDVWELSLDGTPEWRELFPSGQAPSGRLAGAAVYDPMRQRFVGFGGTINQPVDTWVLDLRGSPSWQSFAAADDSVEHARPRGGYGMTSVYDARKDRMLIFGGSTSDSYYGVHNQVWELKLRGQPRWTRIRPDGTPPVPRRSGTAIFDALRNRMVIYGGWDNYEHPGAFLADTWELTFDGDPAWNELAPAGTVPVGRDAMAAAYDAPNDRMVVYGGWSGTDMLGDTQFLSWGGNSDEALLVPDASATPTSAHLEWGVQNATGPYAGVYRRAPGGAWTSIGTAEVEAGNRLVYDDATVTAGASYEYMMVVGSERGETFGGETLVQVPSTTGVGPGPSAEFALGRVAPNPAVDRMSVSFALASDAPARLELVDVAGRRWLDREVGALGAGPQRVELRTAGQVPAGMYFVRLSQAGRIASSRVVVTGR